MTEKLKSALYSIFLPLRTKEHSTFVLLRRGLEKLRHKNGAFLAASGEDYKAVWIRDQVYASYAYYYLDEVTEFARGLQVVFDILRTSRTKIEHALCEKPRTGKDFIHAKYDANALCEVTDDWGHHQVDAIGLFLFAVARAERRGVRVIRDNEDRAMLQLLVHYLAAVRYFRKPDNGMWEENLDLHTSSLGAAVAGLRELARMNLAVVPEYLIQAGEETMQAILPNESPSRDVDMAQLSLLWPYKMVPRAVADVILARVKEKLVQSHGLNRYWGDNYYRSHNGISGEWTMGFFWLAIIYADRREYEEAREWFKRGIATMTPEGYLPELYQNGRPNDHTPLAWAHSLALIAGVKIGEF